VTGFRNRVYLDGERYRNTHLSQFAGEFDCLGGSPTVPVDDDCRSLFLERREDAIVVSIEKIHDLTESLSSMVIPEHFGMDGRVTVAKVCGELNFGVLCVIATDKAADKANDDHVPTGGVSH
jgi:hypothetical protein